MADVPTRKVKVSLKLVFKPHFKAGDPVHQDPELLPGIISERVVEFDVPITISNHALTRDTRFVMSVERARERFMDEMIELRHEIVKET